MNDLIKELENVLTIDGKGRPAKAKALIEILAKYGLDETLLAVQEISERKHV